MRQQSKEYIVILFIVGLLALNYPVVDLFDRSWMPFGIPLLYLYLFLVWLALIVVLIVVVARSEVHRPDQPVALLGSVAQPEAASAKSKREKGQARHANPSE